MKILCNPCLLIAYVEPNEARTQMQMSGSSQDLSGRIARDPKQTLDTSNMAVRFAEEHFRESR